jgi:UDP-N-acetylmuramate dehydrogenase
VLIADEGFNGLVLQIALAGISVEGGLITAAAGEGWDQFVNYCVEKDLAGVECLSGIPGFVGATPIQNVGAYGQEVSETIVSVRIYDRQDAAIKNISSADCGFSYRASIFNTSEKGRYIVLAVTFLLMPNGAPAMRYADLKKYFEAKNKTPSLKEVRDAVIEIRARKSMVIAADDPNSKSAGSFFKNPVVSAEQLQKMVGKAAEKGLIGAEETVPYFPAGEGQVKIPAAWLIERSGFHKGYVQGCAGISANHTLAIINRGGAQARDILDLKDAIQTAVRRKFGVMLKPEPFFVGFEKDRFVVKR